MLNRQIEFEWLQSSDDGMEIAWTQGQFPRLTPPPRPAFRQSAATHPNRAESGTRRDRRLGIALVRDVCIVLIATILASSIAIDDALQAHAGVQREMAAILKHEMQIWYEQDESMYLALMDDNAEASWRREQDRNWRRMVTRDIAVPDATLASAELVGDYALVATDLVENDPVWGAVPYRQYRFYRLVEGDWTRTFPQDHFWGDEQVLETPRLRFEFREWDANVIRSVAGELESIYASLYETLGLTVPSPEQKLTLEIVARTPRSWTAEDRRLKVPSYISLSPHPDLMASDAFIQSVTSTLIFQALRDVRQPYGWAYSSLWNGMFPGLHNWLLTDASGQPPLWHHQAQAVFQERIAHGERLRLMDLNYSSLPTERPEEWLWRMKAGELAIAYIVSTYGRERLPSFINGLSRYTSWHQLIPNVFDVTLEEFEADWNRYMAEEYSSITLSESIDTAESYEMSMLSTR